MDKGERLAAAKTLSAVAQENPDWELASVSLFHALWETGRIEAAFREMSRYLASHESWEYRTLRRDLTAEGFLVPAVGPAGG